ncbi:MAG: peptidoglycan-binding protein [Candidatus Omnitrophota bacterium]
MRKGKGFIWKDAAKGIIVWATAVFLLSGCEYIGRPKKEAMQEKEILGYVKGYNPRVKEIQTVLKEAGFDPGVIDGTMNKQTRKAIKDFQRAKKLKETGFIDAATRPKLEIYLVEKTKSKPDINVEEIKKRLKSPHWIKKIQAALKNSGFDPGGLDGIMNADTKKAIRAFQKSKGLTADGVIGPRTWNELSRYFPKD